MFTLTKFSVRTIAFLLITLPFIATDTVIAQRYHRPLQSVKQLNNLLDSTTSDRLQVSISQPDRQNMKFHVAILNPAARSITITIQRQDDLLFTETITTDRYENVYDLDQLEDGNYLITVRGGKEKFSRNVDIHTETSVNRKAHLN